MIGVGDAFVFGVDFIFKNCFLKKNWLYFCVMVFNKEASYNV